MTAEAFRAHFAAYPSVAQRAEAINYTPDGCWAFGYNYPRGMVNGRRYPLHRLSLEIARGGALGTLHACHTCDNPPCVNPDHLFAGTRVDNALDMVSKGRWGNKIMRGEDNPRSYPPRMVMAARRDYLTGNWTQSALALKYGVSRGAIRGWITGGRSDAGESVYVPPPAPECGTRAGHRAHLKHREKPCDPCRLAANKEQRERYRLRRLRTASP